jgi:hypothetical protein
VWDFEVSGRRFKVRTGLRDIALAILAEPPNRIHIERLNMLTAGLQVSISANGTVTIEQDGLRLCMKADKFFRPDAVIELP